MKTFRVRATDAQGRTATLQRQAMDLTGLRRELEAEGKRLREIVRVTPVTAAVGGALGRRDLLAFFETMDMLLASGLTVQHALEIAADSLERSRLKQLSREMAEAIKRGQDFADSLVSSIPRLPAVLVGILRVGERIGTVSHSVSLVVRYLRSEIALVDRIRGASLYPALVLTILVLGTALLLFVVLPRLERSLSASGVGGATAALSQGIGSVRLMLVAVLAIVALLVLLVFVYRRLRADARPAAAAMERVLFALPILGTLLRARDLFIISFSLETMTANALPLHEAIVLVGPTAWASLHRRGLEEAARRIRHGTSLSTTLEETRAFPRLFTRWVRIAESTGKPESAFLQLKVFYERELERAASAAGTLIEPLLIVLVGAIMIGVIAFVILPLYTTMIGGSQP